jgi:hypothetical protein
MGLKPSAIPIHSLRSASYRRSHLKSILEEGQRLRWVFRIGIGTGKTGRKMVALRRTVIGSTSSARQGAIDHHSIQLRSSLPR